MVQDYLGERALRSVGLAKTFAGVTALDGIDFNLLRGELVGLLGPNGSGKTTLVNCLSGVLRPSFGQIFLFGDEITKWSRERRARAKLIRTYQNVRLFDDLTTSENIEAALISIGDFTGSSRRRRVSEALEMHELANVSRMRISELSYGQQKRVEVARALVCEPKVLILDEPAAGLGQSEAALLGRVLNEAKGQLNCTILLIDHNVSLVMDVSDRIIVLADGKVLRSGRPQEIFQDPDVLQVYLGDRSIGRA